MDDGIFAGQRHQGVGQPGLVHQPMFEGTNLVVAQEAIEVGLQEVTFGDRAHLRVLPGPSPGHAVTQRHLDSLDVGVHRLDGASEPVGQLIHVRDRPIVAHFDQATTIRRQRFEALFQGGALVLLGARLFDTVGSLGQPGEQDRVEKLLAALTSPVGEDATTGDFTGPGEEAGFVVQTTDRFGDGHGDGLENIIGVGMVPNTGEDISIQGRPMLVEQARHLQRGREHAAADIGLNGQNVDW